MLKDRFVFVEDVSTGHIKTSETREDIVDRINDIILDAMLDDEDYKSHLIKDVSDDYKIIEGINNFIGTFIEVIKEKK